MKSKFKTPASINNLLAEEIGLHLGDGSMNYYNKKGFFQLRGHIKDDREHYVYRIQRIYKKLFNIDIRLRAMPSTGVYGFQIWSNELVNYKSNVLGLPLGKKINFSIPEEIIQNEELSRNFLRGYFDTDGCLYLENKRGKPYPRIEMASISGEFVNQLEYILIGLGFRVSHYKENRSKQGWFNLHRIIIRGDKMALKWFNEIKPANQKHVRKFEKLKKWPRGDFLTN